MVVPGLCASPSCAGGGHFAKTQMAGDGVRLPAMLRVRCGWVPCSIPCVISLACSWKHQGMGRYVRTFTITSLENTQPSTETLGV